MTKIAKSREEAWKIQNTYDGQPHGWVQWKGTDACMDIHCKCGTLSHIDAEFLYHVACPNCNVVYFCNGHVELIELADEVPTDDIHMGFE